MLTTEVAIQRIADAVRGMREVVKDQVILLEEVAVSLAEIRGLLREKDNQVLRDDVTSRLQLRPDGKVDFSLAKDHRILLWRIAKIALLLIGGGFTHWLGRLLLRL